MAPVLVVERFLQAVNANDIQTMGRLFGTRQGSILRRDSRRQVEERMFVIASILRHDDYAIVGETVIPGRIGEAVQINVRLQLTDRQARVPFVVVRTRSNEWLIEQVDLPRAMQRAPTGRR
jgi:glutaredoxin 2